MPPPCFAAAIAVNKPARPYRVILNVKLILGAMGLLVFGIWCSQNCCTAADINRKDPCVSGMLKGLMALSNLCRR